MFEHIFGRVLDDDAILYYFDFFFSGRATDLRYEVSRTEFNDRGQ